MVDRLFEYLIDHHPLIFDLIIAIPTFAIAWVLGDIIADFVFYLLS